MSGPFRGRSCCDRFRQPDGCGFVVIADRLSITVVHFFTFPL